MKVENPAALRFILQDEIYLLSSDKALYSADTISVQATLQPAAEEKPLAVEPAPQLPVPKTLPPVFNYLGGHKKNFLVIVHYPDLEFIDDKHLTALQSIIGRLQLTLDDIAILNRAMYPDATFTDLHTFFEPKKLLLLGADAMPAGILPLTLNKLTPVNNYNALYSYSFAEMMDNNEMKKAFWEQMKQL
jgi:hypothetical protein